MSNALNAIVITYKGKEISAYLVAKLAEVLTTSSICTPENVQIAVFDNKDIAENILKENLKESKPKSKEKVKTNLIMPVDDFQNAVVYISELFKTDLRYHPAMFFKHLHNALTNHDDERLSTAVQIIAEKKSYILPKEFEDAFCFTNAARKAVEVAYYVSRNS